MSKLRGYRQFYIVSLIWEELCDDFNKTLESTEDRSIWCRDVNGSEHDHEGSEADRVPPLEFIDAEKDG